MRPAGTSTAHSSLPTVPRSITTSTARQPPMQSRRRGTACQLSRHRVEAMLSQVRSYEQSPLADPACMLTELFGSTRRAAERPSILRRMGAASWPRRTLRRKLEVILQLPVVLTIAALSACGGLHAVADPQGAHVARMRIQSAAVGRAEHVTVVVPGGAAPR